MHANSLPLSSRTSLCDLARQATLSSDSGVDGEGAWSGGDGGGGNDAR